MSRIMPKIMSRTTSRTTIGLLALALLGATAATANTVASHDDSDRGRIVWTNAPDNTFTSGHLVSARPDGRGFRVLTAPKPGVLDIDASVSPDGRWIVYEHSAGGPAGLRIVGADGRHDHALDLGCTDPCLHAGGPVWLPNGRIAFSRGIGPFDASNNLFHSLALYTARPDGTDVRRLSEPGIDGIYEDSYARPAPAGYLVIQRQRDDDGTVALYRMDPRNGTVHQLTDFALNAEHFDVSPARSGPTKDLVVFDSFVKGQTSLDVATVPATCSSLADCTARTRFLTRNKGGARRNGNPSWSLDGRRIAFIDRASVNEVNGDIWTMRYDATDRRRVSTAPDFDYRPDWGAAERR
jgi:Tol biopolymer transport system component